MTNKEAIEFLKNIIDSKAVTLIDNDFTARYHIDALQMAIKVLENERPHGKWIKEDKPFMNDFVLTNTCSICGESFIYHGENANYCPNCGSDMREVDNE